MNYVPLHNHSDYSLLDGMSNVSDMAKRCKKLDMSACALTDHGVMGGIVSFYRACKNEGIKPIIGCEVYICNDMTNRTVKEQYHLVLLAKNNVGYQNLVKLCSEGHLNGFYHKPRIDYKLLSLHSEGLIAMSGCLGGHIPQLLLADEYEEAEALAVRHKEIFGDDYYLEIQNHGIPDEESVAHKLRFMGSELNIKVVATGDSHYVKKEDSKAHALLLAMQTKSVVGSDRSFTFEGDGYHIMSQSEMRERFNDAEISTSLEIADKCDVTIDMETNHYPVFTYDGDNEELLLETTLAGAIEHYGEKTKEFKDMAWERIQYELSIIKRMGFVDYFLVVCDFIEYARSRDIPVGAGRGSGAGSVVAFLTGITSICPLENGLLFERFLNPDRVSPPDFDIDFCEDRREEVIEYVRDKYNGVSKIGTYGTFKIKSAIKSISRALGYDIAFANEVSNCISDPEGTFESALEDNEEFRALAEGSKDVRTIIEYGKKLLKGKCSSGQHACGVIISDQDISKVVPTMLAKDPKTGLKHECTQLDAPECEALGLLKMDFLGLKTLTVCSNTVKNVRANGVDCPSFDDIPLEDDKAYELIRSGETAKVFQIESAGMQETCKSIMPTKLGHLSDILALYRPGPMQYIPTYIDRKNGEEIEYLHPAMEKITGATYGIMVYQEQIMQVVQAIAGLSLAQSDILRRAIGKKKAELLAQQQKVFIEGATGNGVKEDVSESIWADILKFADYGFNKSHSIAYAVLTARTAYLKAHYPAEYLASCMSAEKDMDKVKPILYECNRLGINVKPPCVNVSSLQFTSDGKDIYYGLKAIKGVGASAIEPIVTARSDGEFTTFYNFWSRTGVNKKTIEALAKAGALDSFIDRSKVLNNIKDIMKQIVHFKKVRKRLEDRKAQANLDISPKRNERNKMLYLSAIEDFDNMDFDIPYTKPMTKKEVLKNELESIGCYLSGHPLDDFLGVYDTDILSELLDESNVTLLVNITSVDINTSTNGNKYASLHLVSLEEDIEALMFSRAIVKYENYLVVGDNVFVNGEVKRDSPESKPKLFINKIGEAK